MYVYFCAFVCMCACTIFHKGGQSCWMDCTCVVYVSEWILGPIHISCVYTFLRVIGSTSGTVHIIC